MTRTLCLVHADGTALPLATVSDQFDLLKWASNPDLADELRELHDRDIVPAVLDLPALEEA